MRRPGWTASRGALSVLADRGDGRVEVGDLEGEAPEEGRAVGAAAALERLVGRLHDLEDHLAEAEERLARRARRRRLLADAAQVEPGRLAARRPCDRARA